MIGDDRSGIAGNLNRSDRENAVQSIVMYFVSTLQTQVRASHNGRRVACIVLEIDTNQVAENIHRLDARIGWIC